MNRVTRLIHKDSFFGTRSRKLLDYSHRFVITAEDLLRKKPDPRSSSVKLKKTDSEKTKMIDAMLKGFDAEDNPTDRRIFYEVTGRELRLGEFGGDDDTSDDDWMHYGAPDPLRHAFSYSQVKGIN